MIHFARRTEHALTVEAALVRTLYVPLSSLFLGGVAASAVAWLVHWRTGDPIFAKFALGMFALGTARTVMALRINRRLPHDGSTHEAVRQARNLYIAGAWAFTLLLGLLGFHAMTRTDGLEAPLIVCTFIAGYTAAITGRNSASFVCVTGQNLLSLVPVAAAALLRGGPAYWTIGGLLVLLLYTSTEIALALNRTAVGALVRGEENAALAQRLDEQNAVLRRRELEVAQQNQLFGDALANMPHGLCMFDGQGRLLVANDRTCELLDLPAGALRRGLSARRLMRLALAAGHDSGRTLADLRTEYRVRLAGRDGSRMLTVLRDGRILGLSFRAAAHGGAVVIFEDVTEEKKAEARIAHMATHDALTDLPNRVLFRDAARWALEARTDHSFALLCVDLDGFKAVNDTLGHPAGDALLQAVGQRLREGAEASATTARLGGDEFAILLPGEDRDAVADAAADLIARISEPYEVDGHIVIIGASIGIAVAPDDGVDPDVLIKRADLALYRAKAEGRGTWRFYAGPMDADRLDRRRLDLIPAEPAPRRASAGGRSSR